MQLLVEVTNMNQILVTQPPKALIPDVVPEPELKLACLRPQLHLPNPAKYLSLGKIVGVVAVASILDVILLIYILGNSLHWQLSSIY